MKKTRRENKVTYGRDDKEPARVARYKLEVVRLEKTLQCRHRSHHSHIVQNQMPMNTRNATMTV